MKRHLVLFFIMLALAALACGTTTGGNDGDISGDYAVTGTNPDGSAYSGTATIAGAGSNYTITWNTGSTTYTGAGTLSGNTFTVTFAGTDGATGSGTYTLQDDGSLVGTWSGDGGTGQGTETLTPN